MQTILNVVYSNMSSDMDLERKLKEQDEKMTAMMSTISDLLSRISDLETSCEKYYTCGEFKIHENVKEVYICDKMTDEINRTYRLNLIPPRRMYLSRYGSGGYPSLETWQDFSLYHDHPHTYYGFGINRSCPYIRDKAPQIIPSPNELYNSKEGCTRRLIFTITTVDLSFLSNLSLDKLGLFGKWLNITGDLKHAKDLKCLYFEGVRCDPAIFAEFLSSLINLEELSLTHCSFATDDLIPIINCLPKLTKVWCKYSGITNPSLFRVGLNVV
jgi:hypothetical protein